MDRTTRPLVIVGCLAVSLVTGLVLMLWALGGLRTVAAPAAIGGPFQLADQTGQAVTKKNLLGKPTLIFFGFTHCPDVCPTELFEMSEVLRAMGTDADRVNAYFVSVDPERDTAGAMKVYLSSFDPPLKGLTGDPDAVAKIISEYRVYAKKVPLKDGDYTMDHTALVYLVDRDGKFVAPFNLKQSPQQAAADLQHYLLWPLTTPANAFALSAGWSIRRTIHKLSAMPSESMTSSGHDRLLSVIRSALAVALLAAGMTLAMPAVVAAQAPPAAGAPAPKPAVQAAPQTGPGFWDPRHRPERPDLSRLTVIRFLTETDYPPFNFVGADGNPAGCNGDPARAPGE